MGSINLSPSEVVAIAKRPTDGPWQSLNDYEPHTIIGNVDGGYGDDSRQVRYTTVCEVADNDDAVANTALIIATPSLLAACEAHAAWSWAERCGSKLSTFDERAELCCYSEWLTEKALAEVQGKTWERAYSGVPRMVVWPSAGIVCAEQKQARAIVDRLLTAWRAKAESR